jgi:hypothetical protein
MTGVIRANCSTQQSEFTQYFLKGYSGDVSEQAATGDFTPESASIFPPRREAELLSIAIRQELAMEERILNIAEADNDKVWE